MESSTAKTLDQLAASVVHVAAANSPFRVDSTTQLVPGSSNGASRRDDVDDNASSSLSSLVSSNTTVASIGNCSADTLGCCLAPKSSAAVGLPSVTPSRPDVPDLCLVETKTSGSNGMSVVNHDPKPICDASPYRDVGGGGGDTVVDDMATFRAALDAVDPSALIGLRRARSKSVLVPVCRPPPAAVRFRSRGSVQCEQMTRDDDVDMDDETQHQHHHSHHHQRLYQQQQTAKAVQTSVSYARERFRSASLATQRSRRSRESASMSEMCLEYMRLNGIIPRYPSVQQHDDVVIRSSYMSNILEKTQVRQQDAYPPYGEAVKTICITHPPPFQGQHFNH